MISAVRGGADRLELCANLGLGGGTTPSLGLFNAVHRALPNVPIMVKSLIRALIGGDVN
jgi:copper homeostasis protein